MFLPFAGCPFRCVFCAQDKQTGQGETDLGAILARTEADLDQALAEGRGPFELAFYGGTFTALPEPWPQAFLALAQRYRERGLITHIRCSTRPDCVDPATLSMLCALGLDMVELGVQSFDDTALKISGRGYQDDTARRACAEVREAGLGLGIQLMGGLPGDAPGLFQRDVVETAAIRPDAARFYPCLVLAGTGLARTWERGEFTPWTVERAVSELADGLLTLWARGVPVIRMGLAPEPGLEGQILAGPVHPALGQSARGLALYRIIKDHVAELGRAPRSLAVPQKYQGEFMGHGRELAHAYRDLGLASGAVRYHDGPEFRME